MDEPAPPEAPGPAEIRRPWPWSLGVILVVAFGLYAAGSWWGDPSPRSASALAQGAALANSLASESPTPAADLGSGPGHVRLGPSPLARLGIGLALMTNPTGDDGAWARALACLLLALSWWGICRCFAEGTPCLRSPAPWLLLVALLATDGFRVAAVGAGAGALMIAVSTLMALGLEALARAPGNLWRLGVIWGLAILSHPALVCLGVPIFALGARAYSRKWPGPPARTGDAALPSVPLSLLASPVVALATVLGLWPGLGSTPGGPIAHLASSFDGLWRAVRGPTEAAGHLFDQALNVAPSPGPAAWEALVALPLPLVALALVGGLAPGPQGGKRVAGALLLTVILAGALDGGLTDLGPFLVPLVALLALRGLGTLVSRLGRRASPWTGIKGVRT